MTARPGKKVKDENKPQRLAKGASKAAGNAKSGRTRKNSVRKVRSSDSRRTLADERELSPLGRLLGAFSTEKIRFQVIGMSAANMQGVPGSAIDVDLWLDLPSRQNMKFEGFIAHRIDSAAARSDSEDRKMNFVNRKSEIVNGSWLPDMDLNHDKVIQSHLCYRYTIGQAGASGKLMSFTGQSRLVKNLNRFSVIRVLSGGALPVQQCFRSTIHTSSN
jgi:hypothetical protein